MRRSISDFHTLIVYDHDPDQWRQFVKHYINRQSHFCSPTKNAAAVHYLTDSTKNDILSPNLAPEATTRKGREARPTYTGATKNSDMNFANHIFKQSNNCQHPKHHPLVRVYCIWKHKWAFVAHPGVFHRGLLSKSKSSTAMKTQSSTKHFLERENNETKNCNVTRRRQWCAINASNRTKKNEMSMRYKQTAF